MSIDSCSKCSQVVDTDEDLEFYGEDGDGFGKYQSLCETCRDEWYEEHAFNAPKPWEEILATTMFKE